MEKIELLAPAGSIQALIGAVKSHCDAVYIGGKSFSARASAINFSDEEIVEAVRFCHLRGVKLYVTMNILIAQEEMDKAMEYAQFLYKSKVDAIIIQDLGFAYELRRKLPQMEVHASTQMTVNNVQGAKFLESLGFSRVVVARETSLEEITKIRRETSLEIEHFVHGALCVSYSGQCLMSSMIGGRSGNRGACAQPCRKTYKILDKNFNRIKVSGGDYVISPKDLNTVDHIEKICKSGVTSLKIEGRMKRPEYVVQIVSSYRKALNNIIKKSDKENIEQIFNRGFTSGVSLGDFGVEFISLDRPDNRGVVVGEVISQDNRKTIIKFKEKINRGDGLEFLLKDGSRKGYTSGEDYFGVSELNIQYKVKTNSVVRRTSSIALINSLQDTLNKDENIYPINVNVNLKIGQFAEISVEHKGEVVFLKSENIVERAAKVALKENKVVEQIGKLGDTCYYLESININLDEGAFLPVSQLNALRREALSLLDKIILDKNSSNKPRALNKIVERSRMPIIKGKKISVEIKNLEQLKYIDFSKIHKIYLPYEKNIGDYIHVLNKINIDKYIYFNRILGSEQLENAMEHINSYKAHITGYRADNLGTLYRLLKEDKPLTAGFGLNIFNSKSIELLRDIGINSVFISPELKAEQIRKLNYKDEIDEEVIVYGFLPLMIMKHCPMSLVKGCGNNRDCYKCNFSNGYSIEDERKTRFRFTRSFDTTEIYNSYPLLLLEKIDYLKSMGIENYNLSFTYESKEIPDIINEFYKVIIEDEKYNNKLKERLLEKYGNITYGHLYRGIM